METGCTAMVGALTGERALDSSLFKGFSPIHVRPISLLTLSLLTLLESNFPGKSLGNPCGPGIPPLRINIMLESNPLKPTMLVGRSGVKRICSEFEFPEVVSSTKLGIHYRVVQWQGGAVDGGSTIL